MTRHPSTLDEDLVDEVPSVDRWLEIDDLVFSLLRATRDGRLAVAAVRAEEITTKIRRHLDTEE